MDEKNFEWIVEPILQWYDKQARELPWRKDVTPYRVWISKLCYNRHGWKR